MKNKKVLIILGILVVALVGGGVVAINAINKQNKDIEVHVVPEAESNLPVEEEETEIDGDGETPEEDDLTEEEQRQKEEEEKQRAEEEAKKKREEELAAEADNEKDIEIEDTGNGIVKSTFVHASHTENSDTYLGITGGGDSMRQYFYDFEQFDEFLRLLGREVPEHGEINNQGDVFTAYYADGMYLTYNVSTDKMVVTTGVQSDDELAE